MTDLNVLQDPVTRSEIEQLHAENKTTELEGRLSTRMLMHTAMAHVHTS